MELHSCWADPLCVSFWNVIWNADERWHDAKMTASHKPMLGLILLCVWVWQRREEDVTLTRCQSQTGRGFVLLKPTLSFHFSLLSSLHPSFLSPPYPHHSTCVLMGMWGDVNEAVGVGLGLPSSLFLSTCLSVRLLHLFGLSSWWGFESLWRTGVFSSIMDWGYTLNGPLREPVWWEEGMECGW